MIRLSRLLPVALVPLVCASTVAMAGTTHSWRLTTFKDFEEGEATSVRIRSTGELVAGTAVTRHEIDAALIYSSLALPDGSAALGSGDDGQVWLVDKSGKVRLLAKLDATVVTSLVAAPDGRLWAGTLPGGKIYSVSLAGAAGTAKEQPRELAALDADHIWALTWAGYRSTLYAATGPKGQLYAIDFKGGDLKSGTPSKPRLVWDSGEKQLLSMILDEDGALLIGSAEQAVLYRVVDAGPGKKAEVQALHDFEGDEIRAIARRGRTLYVAVNEFQKAAGALPPPPGPRGTKMSVTAAIAVVAPGMPTRDRKGKGAVFRLDADGRTEQLHALADGYFTALSAESQKGPAVVWAASGGEGKLYRISNGNGEARSGSLQVETAVDLAERQVLTMITDDNGRPRALGTGDAAAWYELKDAPSPTASYTSKVLDAQFVARWGRVRWSGTGTLNLETRSGNTAKADATWTSWQALTNGEHGSDAHSSDASDEGESGAIASARARYLQVRVGFGHASAGAVLRDLSIYYVPQNQPARVVEIATGTDEGLHHHRPHSSVVKVRWKVDNGDDDDLVYRLYFQKEGEPNWRPVTSTTGGAEPLTRPEYDWPTDGLPDGRYLLRVQASDERSNPAGLALTSELTSAPLLIDNRKPEVTDLRVQSDHAIATATGHARDSYSPITELTYSVDGGDWQPLLPKDGVCDSRVEELSFPLPRDLSPGVHSLAVRAYDQADNVGAAQVDFKR